VRAEALDQGIDEPSQDVGRRDLRAPMSRTDPRQSKAHGAVKRAIKQGKLVRPDACSRCGGTAKRIEAHHADYGKPLDIQWLCSGCHAKPKRGISPRMW
jgi:hypothetical protein